METITCNAGLLYITSGSFAGCYPASLSTGAIETGCSNAFAAKTTGSNTAVHSCLNSTSSCHTQTVIDTAPNIGTHLNFDCGASDFAAFTITRTTESSTVSTKAGDGVTTVTAADPAPAPSSGACLVFSVLRARV